MDDNEVYKQWLSYIIEYLIDNSDFNKQNYILDNLFNGIQEDLWIDKVPKDIKICFVKVILDLTTDLTTPGYSFSYSAKALVENFEKKYPRLIDEFLEQLIKSNNINDLKYKWFVENYIRNNEKKKNIEKIFNYLKEKNENELLSEEKIELDFQEF